MKSGSGPIFIGLLMFLGSLGFLVYQGKWIRSTFAGPKKISAAELAKVTRVADMPNPWITITADEFVDTDLGLVTTGNGVESEKSHFVLARVGDRYLVAEIPPNHKGNEVTGFVDHWEKSFAKLRRDALEKVKNTAPQAKDRLLPFQLDAEYSYAGQCYALLGLMGLFAIGGLAFAGMGVMEVMKQPRGSKDMKARKRRRPVIDEDDE